MTEKTWIFGDWWQLLNRELAQLGQTEAGYGEARQHYNTGATPDLAARRIKAVRGELEAAREALQGDPKVRIGASVLRDFTELGEAVVSAAPDSRARAQAMILRPEDWPAWPRLPLVRRRAGSDDCGYLVAGLGLQVFIGNIFAIEAEPEPESERFVTIDELLAEWRID